MAHDHEGKTSKTVTIIVNAREKEVEERELSFAELVALADGIARAPQTEVTVTYTRGHGPKPKGTLVEGQKVKVKKGMIFNVTATDKS